MVNKRVQSNMLLPAMVSDISAAFVVRTAKVVLVFLQNKSHWLHANMCLKGHKHVVWQGRAC